MNTSTLEGSSPPNAMSLASYLVFRNIATEQQRLLRLRLTTTGQGFLVLSSHDQPKFNSMYIEIGEKKIAFGKYNGASSKEMDSASGVRGDPHVDLWLFFDDQYIYVGKDATEVADEVTLARFWAKELNTANHLGLASSGHAQWVLNEGKVASMWYDLTSQLLPRPDWRTSSTIRWRSSTPLRLCVRRNKGDFLNVFEFCKRFGILGDWVFTPTDLSDETLECWPAGGLKTKPYIGKYFLYRVFLNPLPSFPKKKIGHQANQKLP